MKHPFWIVNDALLLILCLTAIFMFLSKPTVPQRVSLEPVETTPVKQEITKPDLSKIYGTNDLFDTFKQQIPLPTGPEAAKPMPLPPTPKLPPLPPKPPLKFLEPLKITLRGIMTGSDERSNIAVIEDAQSTKAKNYKVGDRLEDAQLIRILKNKIILIRSNGQQETLYVAQHDAELEQLLMPESNWGAIIKKRGDNVYAIDPDLFTERVRTLAQCIDLLNLTTVYRQGQSVGCRIGKLDKNSLGVALGLMYGDIVESINDIATTKTSSRFDIYKKIIAMKAGDTITLSVIRKNQKVNILYTLEKFEVTPPSPTLLETFTKTQVSQPAPSIEAKTLQEIEREKQRILEQKYRFAPTAEELQKKEKEAMLKMSQRTHRQNRGMLMDNIQ